MNAWLSPFVQRCVVELGNVVVLVVKVVGMSFGTALVDSVTGPSRTGVKIFLLSTSIELSEARLKSCACLR